MTSTGVRRRAVQAVTVAPKHMQSALLSVPLGPALADGSELQRTQHLVALQQALQPSVAIPQSLLLQVSHEVCVLLRVIRA